MITPRDVETLAFVADRRFSTVQHLALAFGITERGAQMRLTKLVKSGLVRSFPYRLTERGAKVVAEARCVDVETIVVPRPSQQTPHWLAVSDLYCACLPYGIRYWGLNPVYRLGNVRLIPDALIVMKRRIFFAEVDRSDLTKASLRRMERKILKGYNVLMRTPGLWRKDFGTHFPELLVVSGRAKALGPRLAKVAAPGLSLVVCELGKLGGMLDEEANRVGVGPGAGLDARAR